LAEVGRVHVRVHDPTSESRKEKLFRVDTQIEGSTIFLFVNEETGRWPLQIRNETALGFQFQQTVS
jgi:vacuolar protein sorting-associated protein 13A/C